MTCTGRIGSVAFLVASGWILGCGSTQSPPADVDTPVNEAPLSPTDEAPTDDSPSEEMPTTEGERVAFTQCDPEARPNVCTKEYRAVCGEVELADETARVRCITTPCESTERRTFSNGCMACADPNTQGYWPNACDTPVQDAR